MSPTNNDIHKDLLVAVPTYNNATTLGDVLSRLLSQGFHVLVINDGCTDNTEEILSQCSGITIVRHPKNIGKGAAIRSAFEWALNNGYKYVVTIDSDGQHYPEDLPLFVESIQKNPDTLLVGARDLEAKNMPKRNTRANRWSNFWFKVTTGITLEDTQTGYRLYPIRRLQNISLISGKYEYEMEILVRASWRDIPIKSIPIRVYYPSQEKRVSHFRPLRDLMRIVRLNILLVLISLFWIHPKHLFKKLINKER